MSEGNSLATEALSHIRTVKAFASEPMEKALYLETSTEALRLGILDSLGCAYILLLVVVVMQT